MSYSAEDLIATIRSLRREHIHGMHSVGKAGVSPHVLYKEVSQRVSAQQLILLLHELRDRNVIIILGRQGFYEGRGPLCVVDLPLDEAFLRNWRWTRIVDEDEEYFHAIRIYIVADGLPSTVAKQGVVKRALAQ